MANLTWKGATPVSTQFDDVYFSADDGLAESRYVFLESNHLPQRFEQKPQNFTVYELGFGTGLNFLNVLRLWNELGFEFPLNFISVEKYPLKFADMEKSLRVWPVIAPEVASLLEKYKEIEEKYGFSAGWHHLEVAPKIRLSLFIGDATDMLTTAASEGLSRADAWFLDGFAPAKNPDMWDATIFENMAKLSQEGTTFATFTAAGAVRRGLQDAGFSVQKVKGFGRKRDMTVGKWCASL